MDKGSIKKYAAWARRELISRVSQKAQQFGITEKEIVEAGADSVCGRLLSTEEKKQRQALIGRIRAHGYEQVMEEVAYTWFNRFSALRFMEVNGYLPTHVRVFTDDENSFKPQILAEAIHLELDGLNMDKVYALKEKNDDDALFKYLLITQCNALSAILPGMFQRISDYTELLFPDNLLRDGSVPEQMITLIPEADWKDQVQIIGWLYQYYNTEPKDKVFADLKKNIKISKENIPAATQLFTPDWIVRYMVENSLGRLWVEVHPSAELKTGWKYYLEEAQQEPEVQAQLEKIREEYKALKPENIKCIDPCMGSGHILVYMFDVLMQIYASCGYSDRDAVRSIIENNLYGLDIDDRAAQLAYFSVMMKARQYDARFFSRKLQPHVYAICESNGLSAEMVNYFVGGNMKLKKDMDSLITEMRDAKEYGSILNITPVDFDALYPLCGGIGIMAGTRNAAGQAQYLISSTFAAWESICTGRFNQLKSNEEELNCIFIDIYGLQDELTPEVEDKDVTVRLADKKRDIRSLISYAVGCMFGRYSLDMEGLAYAGGEWDESKYKTFPADKDNIIPICDDEYFEDDITGRFVKFIETVYGKETLDENLRFIADALTPNPYSLSPKDVLRSYFLNDFYADHLKIYQKRPIYWLFDSGKKNGFKALIYMHRYAPDTLARMRTDYVHEQQARYRTAIADLTHRIDSASASERVKLTKQLAKLTGQADEIRAYEEKIHHLADQMIRIDLDDGVKHNYAIFEDVLAKIK